MKKSDKTTPVLLLVLLAGLSLLLYPSFADYWNSFHASRAIAGYAEEVAHIDNKRYEEMWAEALDYTHMIADRNNPFALTEEQKAAYDKVLNVSGTGIMSYIEIPSIRCILPIYHGTDDAVLQVAIGHLEWTSLPIGGESTHCVISGHRGLPRARLFTDLDQLEVGDTFLLRTLDEVLTYEVDQISIVEPSEIENLLIEEGQDLCTLVTCTPYGINTHRLLVRGHRIDTVAENTVRITADAMQIEPMLVAPIVAIPMLLVLLVMLLIPRKKK